VNALKSLTPEQHAAVVELLRRARRDAAHGALPARLGGPRRALAEQPALVVAATKRATAAEWLDDRLADDDVAEIAELVDEAAEAEFSRATLYRAAKLLRDSGRLRQFVDERSRLRWTTTPGD
jgi:hypothetical protein